MADDLSQRYPLEIEPLTSGEDGYGYLMGFGGSKNEFHVSRRLFKGLEEGIEGREGQHMDFVDNVNAILARRGHIFDISPEFSDFIDAAIGCAVDLLYIHG